MQRFPTYPCPLHTHRLHHYQHPPECGTFVTTDEPTLAPHNPLKPVVYGRVHCWCCAFCGFGQVYNMQPSVQYHAEYFHCGWVFFSKKGSFQKIQKYVLPSVTNLERDVLFQLQFEQAPVWILTGSAQPT